MFSPLKMKFNRSLCSWRRTAKFISADGLYEFPAGHGEPRTGLRRAAQGDGREQGHAECVVNTVRQRGLLCTRKFHVEGVDWALYSAMAKCCESSRAKLVTSPTTIVVGLQNQVQFRTNLTNLLPQSDASTRSSHQVWRTKCPRRVCKLISPRSYGTFRNSSQPRLGCLGRGEIIDSQILGHWNKSSPSGQASKDAMRTILTGQRATLS